jgi:hypothetical protein
LNPALPLSCDNSNRKKSYWWMKFLDVNAQGKRDDFIKVIWNFMTKFTNKYFKGGLH